MSNKVNKYMKQYQERNYAPKGRVYLDRLIEKRDNARKKEALCKTNVEPVAVMLKVEESIVPDCVITSPPEENTTKVMKTYKKQNIKKVKADLFSNQEKFSAKHVQEFS